MGSKSRNPIDSIVREYLGPYPLGGNDQRATWIAACEGLEKSRPGKGGFLAPAHAVFDAVEYLVSIGEKEKAVVFPVHFEPSLRLIVAEDGDKYRRHGSVLLRVAEFQEGDVTRPRPLSFLPPDTRCEYGDGFYNPLAVPQDAGPEELLELMIKITQSTQPPQRLPVSSINLHFRVGDFVCTIGRANEQYGRSERLLHGAHVSDSLPQHIPTYEVQWTGQSRQVSGVITRYSPGTDVAFALKHGLLGISVPNLLGQMADVLHTVHHLDISRARWPELPPDQPKTWEGNIYSGLYRPLFEGDLDVLLQMGRIDADTRKSVRAR